MTTVIHLYRIVPQAVFHRNTGIWTTLVRWCRQHQPDRQRSRLPWPQHIRQHRHSWALRHWRRTRPLVCSPWGRHCDIQNCRVRLCKPRSGGTELCQSCTHQYLQQGRRNDVTLGSGELYLTRHNTKRKEAFLFVTFRLKHHLSLFEQNRPIRLLMCPCSFLKVAMIQFALTSLLSLSLPKRPRNLVCFKGLPITGGPSMPCEVWNTLHQIGIHDVSGTFFWWSYSCVPLNMQSHFWILFKIYSTR